VEAAPGTSGLAVTSLILGVLSWIGMPLLGGIAAVIAGHVARNDIRKAAGRVGGASAYGAFRGEAIRVMADAG
jgi:hypothetical protein